MPLEILLPMVAIGITTIVVLTHLFGFSKTFKFTGDELASARWLRENPYDTVDGVVINHDRSVALISASSGLGAVWAMGADTTTRHLDHSDIEITDYGLMLRLHDFAAPKLHLQLDTDEMQLWQAKLKELNT